MTPVKTLVVDDSMPMRKAIKDALQRAKACDVIGEAANGLEAVELARALRPNLIVLDVNMPVMGGIEALRVLRSEFPCTQVVMVSSILEGEVRDHALGLGAAACLEKGPELWERLPAIVTELAVKCPAKT